MLQQTSSEVTVITVTNILKGTFEDVWCIKHTMRQVMQKKLLDHALYMENACNVTAVCFLFLLEYLTTFIFCFSLFRIDVQNQSDKGS